MTRQNARTWVAKILGSLLLCGATSVAAEQQASDEQLLDQWVGSHISAETVPGASAAIVHGDGKVVLRGYGKADLQRNVSVDPERTIFRVGSISKTFTAIAILQLVDEGKIKLEEDANRYLKGIKIPSGPAPVRIVDLLTHRSGFDTELSYVGLDDPVAAMQSSDSRMQRDLYRLRPPGVVTVYDNTAWGVLGQLIESVDGVPYATALRNRIFSPLGMHRTQVGLPAGLDGVAVAYEVGPDGKPAIRPHTYLRRGWQGAGDISSTAGDMARFLSALLKHGETAQGRLLRKETFDRFVDTGQFRVHPQLPGIGLGVYSLGTLDGGAFGHAGTIRGFNAVFMVLPAQDLAVFAVMNLNKAVPELSLNGILSYLAQPPGQVPLDPTDYMLIDLPDIVSQQFQTAPVNRPVDAVPSEEWSGRYAGMRMESFEALLPRLAIALLTSPQVVMHNPDGSMQIGARGPYRTVGPDVFKLDQHAGPLFTRIGFAKVGDLAVMGPHTLQVGRRLSWYERPVLTAGGLILAPLLLLVLSAVRWAFVRGGTLRHDGVVLLSSATLLLGLYFEIAWASVLIRLQGLEAVPLLWRLAIHLALALLVWRAAAALLKAYRSAENSEAGCAIGKVHASGLALLVAWLVLATIYWHVFARFWG